MSDAQQPDLVPENALPQQEAEKNLRIQMAVNSVLRISLEPVSLEELLRRVLNLILDLPWLILERKGCIFLADAQRNRLVMRAQVGMSAGVLATCSQVEIGTCLCGRAFLEDRLLF